MRARPVIWGQVDSISQCQALSSQGNFTLASRLRGVAHDVRRLGNNYRRDAERLIDDRERIEATLLDLAKRLEALR